MQCRFLSKFQEKVCHFIKHSLTRGHNLPWPWGTLEPAHELCMCPQEPLSMPPTLYKAVIAGWGYFNGRKAFSVLFTKNIVFCSLMHAFQNLTERIQMLVLIHVMISHFVHDDTICTNRTMKGKGLKKQHSCHKEVNSSNTFKCFYAFKKELAISTHNTQARDCKPVSWLIEDTDFFPGSDSMRCDSHDHSSFR